MAENDHIDGYVKWLRSHVGHELIYLVYAIALVFDDEGNLLVQTRYDFDWLSVPGGVYEPHEKIADSIRREVLEETGIVCAVERFIGVFSHPEHNLLYPNGDQVQPWTAAFVCRATGGQLKADGKETLHATFRTPDTVKSQFPAMYRYALDAVQQARLPFIEPIHFEPDIRPYYPILRRFVGSSRIILPGCVAVVFNDAGLVLAVYKAHKAMWALPGGLADLGETTSGTIRREVLEETGLIVQPTNIVGIYSDPALTYLRLANGDEVQTVDLLMTCEVVSGELRPDGHEVTQAQFMPLGALLAQSNLTPLHRRFLEDIQNQDGWPFIG